MIFILKQKICFDFLERFDFVLRFVRNCIKNIKISMFQEIFSNFEYSSSYLKVINQEYIEYCDRKYAN